MRKLLFSIALSIIIILTGCGHVKDAGQLYKYAKKTYGKCQVVSKVEEENMTKLVLKDRLQGFNYTVTSSMSDISIDGSSFGSLPSTSDTFNKSLTEYVRTECSLKLNDIKSKYGIDIEAPDFVSETIVTLLIPASVSKTDAIKAATEIAEEFQVSRQAVYDNIKRTEKILEDYEMKLHMYSDYIVRSQIFDEITTKYPTDEFLQEKLAV